MLKPGVDPMSLRTRHREGEFNDSPMEDDGDADQDQAHRGRGLGRG